MDKGFVLRLGFTCNNSCVMCFFLEKLGTADMTTEEAEKNIELARKENAKLILTGGEPTIRKDFIHLLSYAVKIGVPSIMVQTNGRMLYYEEFVKKIKEIQRGDRRISFLIPVYGHNERVHDAITKSPGSFSQTIKGIRNLLKHEQDFFVKTLYLKSNYKYLPDIVEFLTDLNVKFLTINSACIPEGVNESIRRTVPRFREVIPHLFKALRNSDREKLKISLASIPLCIAGGYENFVDERVSHKFVISKSPGQKLRKFRVPRNAVRDSSLKIKINKCRKCRFYRPRDSSPLCGGIWKEYIKMYGEDEFNPVQ